MKKYLIFFIALTFIGCIGNKQGNDNKEINENSKNTIKVALLQLNPVGSGLNGNLRKGEEYCRKAKKMGVDIVLFPEMWSIGYSGYHWPESKFTKEKYPLNFEEWKALAIDSTGNFIKFYQQLAKELQISIVITYLEKCDGSPKNSASVIDSEGQIIMNYSKVHTSDMHLMESNCTPGNDFYVCDLPVKNDTVKIGIMICFDREFPESARILMLKGAELVLTPNACTLREKRINQFQTRAFENAFGVAMANYAYPTQNGHSCAFDANGDEIIVADEKEGLFVAEFNMNKIREYRKRTIWGNAYRRPQKYGLLTSPDVDSTFIRKNGLGKKFERSLR